MIFQNLSPSYSKPMASIRVAGQVRGTERKKLKDIGVWMSHPLIGVTGVLCLFFFGASLYLGSHIDKVNTMIQDERGMIQSLSQQADALTKEKAHFMSAEQVQLAAAEKLDLHHPGARQVHNIY